MSDNLNSMIKECGYPNSPESRLNIDTLDVVVGGKFKKDQGKLKSVVACVRSGIPVHRAGPTDLFYYLMGNLGWWK